MQECLYEALAPYAGKSVLQAIGEQHGLGFLMADGTLTVAQASVISGTDSDPRFEQYYALFCRKSSPTSSFTMMPRSATWPNSTPGSSSTLPSQTATPCSTARPVYRCSSSGNFCGILQPGTVVIPSDVVYCYQIVILCKEAPPWA